MSDSPPEDLKTATPVAEAPAEKPAESPPADGADSKSPPSMLDTVKAALAPRAETESSTVDKSPEKEGSETAAPAEDDGEEFKDLPSKEELQRLHSKTRRRMQWFMDKMSGQDTEIQELKPQAEAYARVQKYIADAGLDTTEVNTGFEVMRAIKANDPWKALEKLRPIMAVLEKQAGVVLPPELQEQARGGYISEAHAQELAQLRAREAANRQTIERQQQANFEQQRQAATQAVTTELSSWESSKAASDPDYQAKKAPFLHEALQAKWARGERPRNPQEAREQAEKTMKEVEDRLRSILPKPVEIRPTTGSTTPAAKPQVASMVDVVRRAVGR